MLRGLYTAAAGMISSQRRHDTITNNISNLNTPGFKQGNAVARSFPEMLIAATRGTGANAVPIGRLSTAVLAEEDVSTYMQGDLQETKNPYDVAVFSNLQQPGLTADGSGKAFAADGSRVFQPQAFFTVLDPSGEKRYTRNGKFVVDPGGVLVTPDGYKVLGTDGNPITLTDPATGLPLSNVKLTEEGRLLDEVDGRPIMRGGAPEALLISRIEQPNRLVREGNGVFRVNPEEAGIVTELTNPQDVQKLSDSNELKIRQGFLERSNVDATQSMVDLMTAQRAYEANQKIIQYYDKSLEKAANEIGKV
jgi:flagellar basal-body rod protein FlgF